jgi:hypothetical protein
MAQETIINHRNMTAMYFTWLIALLSIIGYTWLAYVLQFSIPFMEERSLTPLVVMIVITGIFAMLALTFKFVFKQERISWLLADVIGIVGLAAFITYGWNVWFLAFYALSFGLLLGVGPYLHFD